MKKGLAIIVVCCMLLACLAVSAQDLSVNSGYEVAFNGEATGYASVVLNDVHYVPMDEAFETMGAYMFYRSRDGQLMALTRNGDTVLHVAGENTLTVNGQEIVFTNPSVWENNKTYIPLDMLSAVFYPDAYSFENGQLNIQKQTVTNEYHKIVNDILGVCAAGNFYPERFERYINYHVKMPDLSIEDIVFRVNLGLDVPFYENVSTIEHPNELLVLVNKYNLLPPDFQQYNLVHMEKKHRLNDGKTYLLEAGTYEKYVQMSDAAKKDGVSMYVVSAHRTEAYQRNLYEKRLKSRGRAYADSYTARPGASEHQTGLAVDINSTSGTFQYTEAFKWLQKHAHEYGFIMRYPKGKEWITGYSYEPWHYRYVGVDVAKIIYAEGITYEEYYAKYISVKEFQLVNG